MDDNSKLFDRALYHRRRERMAVHWKRYDFLKREAAYRVAECVNDVTRHFATGLDLGCHHGEVAQALGARVANIVQTDHVFAMANQAGVHSCVCDEESLPFAEDSFDVITSALALHHVNDLVGTLIQIRRALAPNGLFVGLLFGAGTLRELRGAITEASARHGFALSPRISPFIEVRDGGALLQRAGFALPVADSDNLEVDYPDIKTLLRDLRGMGEANILHARQRQFTTRTHWARIEEQYRAHYARDGALPATFEFVTLSGWKA